MQRCRLSISTTADGEKSGFLTDGEIENTPAGVRLQYRNKNANVVLELSGVEAYVERKGDYSLSLRLREGETTKGFLGIGGNQGELSVYTREVSCERKEESWKLHLRYDLIMGEEPQRMELTLLAKPRG